MQTIFREMAYLAKKIRNSSSASNAKLGDALAYPSVQSNEKFPFRELIDPPRQMVKSVAEKEADRDIVLSLSMFGAIGILQSLYAPLYITGALAYLYFISRHGIYAYKAWKYRRQITTSVLDVCIGIAIVLSGYYMLGILPFTFSALSRKLLARTEDHSHKSLVNIFGTPPKSVWVLNDGAEIEVPFEQLQKENIVVIGAGQMIPIDGLIHKGIGSVDQHVLTGESQPVEKGEGDQVFASTVVLAGKIYIEVQKTGSETTAAQIGQILDQTVDFKQHIQSKSETIGNASVLPTLGMSLLALPIGGMSSTLAVLESSIGYSLRLTGPISMLNSLRIASQEGILIKDGRSLELLEDIDTVVFDKTGTLTQEQPQIHKIHCFDGFDADQLLSYAAAAESRLHHPIAKAIVEAAEVQSLTLPAIEDAHYQMGYGVKVRIGENRIYVGSNRFMEMENITSPAQCRSLQIESHQQGYSVVMIGVGNHLAGAIVLKPTIRPEAKMIINDLQQRGLSLYIISGDQEEPTRKLADELGISLYFANTLPEKKALLIEELQASGKKVCFVGDGINDSIALKKANVSISMSGATTVATDTAQIVFMDGSLKQFPILLDLAHEFNGKMKFNVLTSVVPGLFCIGGVFLFHFGFISSLVIYGLTLLFGVSNAMLTNLGDSIPRNLPKLEEEI